MKISGFPALALAIAVLVQLVLVVARTRGNNGEALLPLLTLLVMAEFGFGIALAGAYSAGIQQMKTGFTAVGTGVALLCTLLAFGLLVQGIDLWPL